MKRILGSDPLAGVLPTRVNAVIEAPLIIAVRLRALPEAIEAVLATNADPNVRDANGLSALDHLIETEVQKHKSLDLFYSDLVLPDFKKRIMRATVKDQRFLGALVTSSMRQCCVKALLLLRGGADPHSTFASGLSAAARAHSHEGFQDLAKLLQHFQDAETWQQVLNLQELEHKIGCGADVLERVGAFLVPHQWQFHSCKHDRLSFAPQCNALMGS